MGYKKKRERKRDRKRANRGRHSKQTNRNERKMMNPDFRVLHADFKAISRKKNIFSSELKNELKML